MTSHTHQRLTYPLEFIPQFKGSIPNAKGGDLTCGPVMIPLYAIYSAVATIVTNGFSASHAGNNAAGTTNMTLGGSLATAGVGTNDVPRNVVITVTHATSIVAMSGVITGTDQYGATITEAWAVTATGTSKTFTGAKAFKTVTSITEVIAADASANTIIAGNGKVLGLPFKAAFVNIGAEMIDGAIPGSAGVIVAASTASTADFRGTYTPNDTPNGTHKWEIIFWCYDVRVQ